MLLKTITYCRLVYFGKREKWTQFLFIFFSLIPLTYADPLPPLIVATEMFNPPFIMQGANKQLFGFDIEMMEDICEIIHRKCIYRSEFMENTLLSSIEKHEADIGVSSITITLERSERVNFSYPYLPSDVQYLALKKWAAIPFSKDVLNEKKIGVQVGTIYEQVIKESGLSDVQIINYSSTNRLIKALGQGEVDFILQDALAAQYWITQIPIFTTFGKPFTYGYGFGIAVNKSDKELLQQINNALVEFEENGQFKKTYDRYVGAGK
ncbi:transporter substrate-binding domain-containing protein [Legionella sp. WA2024007413]